jgi:hypothetical protein
LLAAVAARVWIPNPQKQIIVKTSIAAVRFDRNLGLIFILFPKPLLRDTSSNSIRNAVAVYCEPLLLLSFGLPVNPGIVAIFVGSKPLMNILTVGLSGVGRWKIYGMERSDSVLEKIYNKNAERMFSQFRGVSATTASN